MEDSVILVDGHIYKLEHSESDHNGLEYICISDTDNNFVGDAKIDHNSEHIEVTYADKGAVSYSYYEYDSQDNHLELAVWIVATSYE